MKISVAIILIAVLAIAISGLLLACRNVDSSAYTTGLERYDLSASEVSTLETKAKAGDQRAAKKLMLYYGYVRRDNEAFEQWRKIAEP
jgi:hypothetical protein